MLTALVWVGLLAPPTEPPRASDAIDPVTVVGAELPRAPAVEPEPVPQPAPAPEPLALVTAAAPERRCLASRRCAGMRIGGGLVGGLGLAAVGTGIGLLVRPDEVIPERPAFVTSTHPAGLATLTLGVGVTLTAVLILVASRSTERRVAGRQALRLDPAGLHF
jgi:hypothetical protein